MGRTPAPDETVTVDVNIKARIWLPAEEVKRALRWWARTRVTGAPPAPPEDAELWVSVNSTDQGELLGASVEYTPPELVAFHWVCTNHQRPNCQECLDAHETFQRVTTTHPGGAIPHERA